jgi:ADP-heptose:LPS heptosyltransferase
MPFRTLLPLLALDATFVSLQKEVRRDDRALLEMRTDLIDLTGELTDFAETAALIENLDLVITVDTSIAHLAGTLGRPTWVMLSHVGEWRWLAKREDSPWYPTVRLFRQDETRDYADVVERVRAGLQSMISDFKP